MKGKNHCVKNSVVAIIIHVVFGDPTCLSSFTMTMVLLCFVTSVLITHWCEAREGGWKSAQTYEGVSTNYPPLYLGSMLAYPRPVNEKAVANPSLNLSLQDQRRLSIWKPSKRLQISRQSMRVCKCIWILFQSRSVLEFAMLIMYIIWFCIENYYLKILYFIHVGLSYLYLWYFNQISLTY